MTNRDHSMYAASGVDNIMVLLDRNMFTMTEVMTAELDDWGVLLATPANRGQEERQWALFRYTH